MQQFRARFDSRTHGPELKRQWCFEVRLHHNLSVADDELAGPVSLQLRSHQIDGSEGDFRLIGDTGTLIPAGASYWS
jgi:hypothetical protein